jgi:hypothetical protein
VTSRFISTVCDDENPSGRQIRPTPVLVARVNRRLHRLRIERLAIAFRAEVEEVVDAGPKGIGAGGGRRGGQQTRAE